MNKNKPSSDTHLIRPLLLWPGIVIVILLWVLRFGIPYFAPGAIVFGVFSGLIGGVAVVLWWSFFSRAPGIERWIAVLLMILILIATSFLLHESIATGGQGMMFYIYAIPVLTLAFVIWAVATRNLSNRIRRISMVVTIIVACGFWIFFRNDGITGDFNIDLKWRWAKTPEERLLASEGDETDEFSSLSVVVDTNAQWPGFRGPDRNGIIKGLKLKTDWSANPPKEQWRKPVGPGCSSFAVSGDYFFTQEQRGEYEIVSCYNINTGEAIWKHKDKARFWDSHAGAGPRSTPTLSNGRVYTLGATGILNVLNANDGSVVWSENAVEDADVIHSGWGYSSSPLVVDDVVIVAAVGKLVGYDRNTGSLQWMGPDGGDSYSSPHLLNIQGVDQVLLLSGKGVRSFVPDNGTILWEYDWPGGSRIVQPAILPDGDLLISNGDGNGLRRIQVDHDSGKWTISEVWTTLQLKPNFNDFVLHDSYAYGFKGSAILCINVENGERMWQGNRYGGQVILLEDQGLLLVLSEKGKVALVSTSSDSFTELGLFSAIEGKTWNHPVLVNDVLLVRNTQEMAAYQLSVMSN